MKHIITGTLLEKNNIYLLSLFEEKFKMEFTKEKEAINTAHNEMKRFFLINNSPTAFIYKRKSGKKSIIQFDIEPDGEEWYECSLTDYWNLHHFYKNEFNPKLDTDHKNRDFYFMNPKLGLEIIAEDIIKTKKIINNTPHTKINNYAQHCIEKYNDSIEKYFPKLTY